MTDGVSGPADPDLPQVRPMANPWAVLPWKGGRCLQCPVHSAERGWCPVQAVRKAGREPMCRYGYALLAKMKKENGEQEVLAFRHRRV